MTLTVAVAVMVTLETLIVPVAILLIETVPLTAALMVCVGASQTI